MSSRPASRWEDIRHSMVVAAAADKQSAMKIIICLWILWNSEEFGRKQCFIQTSKGVTSPPKHHNFPAIFPAPARQPPRYSCLRRSTPPSWQIPSPVSRSLDKNNGLKMSNARRIYFAMLAQNCPLQHKELHHPYRAQSLYYMSAQRLQTMVWWLC